MDRLVLADLDVLARRIRELGVPAQILGTVKAAPVPVGTHDGRDEVGVILVRRSVIDKGPLDVDVVGGRGDGGGREEGEKGGEELHGVVGCWGRFGVGVLL